MTLVHVNLKFIKGALTMGDSMGCGNKRLWGKCVWWQKTDQRPSLCNKKEECTVGTNEKEKKCDSYKEPVFSKEVQLKNGGLASRHTCINEDVLRKCQWQRRSEGKPYYCDRIDMCTAKTEKEAQSCNGYIS